MMVNVQSISKTKLYWRKIGGCYREFGTIETVRRMGRELFRPLRKSETGLDISLVTKDLAIGAAPKSFSSIRRLRDLGFMHVIDLRAERKQSDILAETREVSVRWVPIYDDWSYKPQGFYQKLEIEIKKMLLLENGRKIFICCGAGEHRAPLAGVLALVVMGYSTESAVAMIKKVRPQAELPSAYKSSLIQFLGEQKNDS